MCSVAPRAAAPSFGATAFLDRQRGVAAATMAPASSHDRTGEPIRRARAVEVPSAPAHKRGRHDGFDVVDRASSSSALQVRMDKELVALQGLLKRAKMMPRSGSAAPAAKKEAAPAPRPSEAPAVSLSAAKRKASPSKSSTAKVVAPEPAKQQQHPVQVAAAKNPIAPDVPNKHRPAEAPAAQKQKQKQQRPVQRAAAAKTEVPKKRRPEEEKEIARAREEFRQMLLDMEKSVPPDEMVYPEELEELGIPFEFVFTRTWKQACLDYQATKKLRSVAV